MPIIIKSPDELALMRQAGRIVAQVLALLRDNIKPGVTTADLDQIAYEVTLKQGAFPSFRGYRGFPASLCVSINEEVVHGIPNRERLLREGDIVALDFGAIYQGFQGDAAITVGVGRISRAAERLIGITEEALRKGIEKARAGNRLTDISAAIQAYAESQGYSVVRQYVGHGIGRNMHEEPQVPNFGSPGRGPVLKPGMTLAIEPMLNAGSCETTVREDTWTVVTQDGALSAHFEHTIAITAHEPEILTRL